MVRGAARKKKNMQLPDLIICCPKCGPVCQAAQRKEKQQAAFGKPIRSSEKKPFKHARKKLEIPMEAPMPCKLRTYQYRRTCGESNEIRKSKHACIVEAHESTRKRLERTLPKHHEDRIAGKGFNSLSHYNLVPKIIPMFQAMKIPDKAAIDKEWEKLENLPAGQMTKVKSKKEVILEALRERHADGHLSSQKCGDSGSYAQNRVHLRLK